MSDIALATDFSALSDAQLLRITYSLWDFQQALSALTFLMEECDFEAKYSVVQLRRFRCYESTVIISFARPFELSRGQTVIGLKAIGVQLTQEERRLKERIMKLRRKVIAHSDENAMHFNIQLMEPLEGNELKLPLVRFAESLHFSASELRPLETLLARLTSSITTVLFRLAQTNPERIQGYKTPSGI